jgi:hypothetical protein
MRMDVEGRPCLGRSSREGLKDLIKLVAQPNVAKAGLQVID